MALTSADAVLAGPSRPLDHRADRLGDGVDVGLGGRVPEREPQRPAGQRLGHAHRQQHVARLRDPGRAGRPGRALDAAGVQQQQQGVALAAGEGEVRVAGQAVLRRQPRVTAEDGVRHDLEHPAYQVVTKAGDPLGALGPALDGHLGRRGEAHDRGGVQGAGAHVALLPATVQDRHQVDGPAEHQQAGPERPAELVPGHGHRVQAAGREVERERAERLHRVGVERHVVRRRDRGQRLDRLDGADLVVGPHDRDQRDRAGVGREGRLERLGVHPAGGVDRQPLDHRALVLGQPEHGVHHRVVLDRAGQDAAPVRVLAAALPVEALDREVVRLGAATGEQDLAGPRPERRGEGLAGLLDQPPGGPAGRVQRRRVADVAQPRRHRLDRLGDHRRGRRVVEVEAADRTVSHRRRSLRRARRPSHGSVIVGGRPR